MLHLEKYHFVDQEWNYHFLVPSLNFWDNFSIHSIKIDLNVTAIYIVTYTIGLVASWLLRLPPDWAAWISKKNVDLLSNLMIHVAIVANLYK